MNKIKKTIIIAEIGCNHKGNFNIAKKMIEIAASCGADYAKFQKRDNKKLLGSDYNKPHPVPENSYGSTYGKHRDYLEFSIDQHKKLFQHCKKNKIKYSVSVWDTKSAEEVIKKLKNIDYIKVPSACNLNFELLSILGKKFKKKIHISLGMTKNNEIKKIYNFFRKLKRHKDLIFYACTSDYPANFYDTCLLEISKLKKQYSNINDVAYSGHHLGISIDIASIVLGAKYVERHFTLDRTWKGTDHAASLEPSGLKKLTRDIRAVESALKEKPKKGILKSEVSQRKKLKQLRTF